MVHSRALTADELDSDDASTSERLRDLEHEILEAVATGRTLSDTMLLLCRRVEEMAPEALCSVLAVDEQGRLQHIASPSLPADYSQSIDGTPIGPNVGSCGTAAFRAAAVEVTDIATDPLWSDYRHLALPLGLRACWSSPITASDGRVIGTFAFYHRTPTGPGELERRIVVRCLYHCAIAIEHDLAQSKIQQLAWRDPLTKLPNRAYFEQRAAEALRGKNGQPVATALHYIDLDDFKGVNDSLGHHVGDQLLISVANRLAACVSTSAIVARLGGDEFAILQTDSDDPHAAADQACRVIDSFSKPFTIESHQIRIGATVGIAHAAPHGSNLVELLRKADLALYRAKALGRNRWQSFTPDMDAELQRRRSLQQDLHTALETENLKLHYQPIVDLSSGRIVCFEALLRWQHPEHGLVPPAEFIPLAEESGLIDELGTWVLKQACSEAAQWPDSIGVAVNLSSRQLRNDRFAFDVINVLRASGLAPERLELELTESALLLATPAVTGGLRQLSASGVRIALDDFGTGYSSLSYLRSFPINKLKIDQTFVADLASRPDCAAIVRAIIGLAQDLGMKTTAEGIETEEQRDFVCREGCCEGQGFLFGAPVATFELPMRRAAAWRSQHQM